jgi:hypothetical protein
VTKIQQNISENVKLQIAEVQKTAESKIGELKAKLAEQE